MGFNRRTWVTTLGCAVVAEAKNESAANSEVNALWFSRAWT